MAINEKIITGRLYRRYADAAKNLWERISFWTASSDVELDNGTRLDAAIIDDFATINSNTRSGMIAGAKAVKEMYSSLGKSVSDGKTLVANAITNKGISTATNAEFSTMASNISRIVTQTDRNFELVINVRVTCDTAAGSNKYGSGNVTITRSGGNTSVSFSKISTDYSTVQSSYYGAYCNSISVVSFRWLS